MSQCGGPAVLAGHPQARPRIDAARAIVCGNPIAIAIVDRADALHRGEPGLLPDVAAACAAASEGGASAHARCAGMAYGLP